MAYLETLEISGAEINWGDISNNIFQVGCTKPSCLGCLNQGWCCVPGSLVNSLYTYQSRFGKKWQRGATFTLVYIAIGPSHFRGAINVVVSDAS